MKANLNVLHITEEMKHKADELISVILQRFNDHLEIRIHEKSKHNHWFLILSRKNTPVDVSIMCLFGHFKADTTCLDGSCSLMFLPNRFLFATNTEANIQEAYLYYDQNNLTWIRSGKVTGRGFTLLHNKHAKRSRVNKLTSSSTSRF